MPTGEAYKIRTKKKNLFLRVIKGHFATSHSHINYYIDVTAQKSRLTEAQAVAQELVAYYNTTIVDTILCLDGMEVIGTCLAEELTRGGYSNLNSHQTIYIVTPEHHTSGSMLIFRENVAPMITGKNVLILSASVNTGYTARAAIEAIKYYGGNVAGIASIFSTINNFMGNKVESVFNPNDLIGYGSFASHECPMCRAGEKIDALVNSHGYSKL